MPLLQVRYNSVQPHVYFAVFCCALSSTNTYSYGDSPFATCGLSKDLDLESITQMRYCIAITDLEGALALIIGHAAAISFCFLTVFCRVMLFLCIILRFYEEKSTKVQLASTIDHWIRLCYTALRFTYICRQSKQMTRIGVLWSPPTNAQWTTDFFAEVYKLSKRKSVFHL